MHAPITQTLAAATTTELNFKTSLYPIGFKLNTIAHLGRGLAVPERRKILCHLLLFLLFLLPPVTPRALKNFRQSLLLTILGLTTKVNILRSRHFHLRHPIQFAISPPQLVAGATVIFLRAKLEDVWLQRLIQWLKVLQIRGVSAFKEVTNRSHLMDVLLANVDDCTVRIAGVGVPLGYVSEVFDLRRDRMQRVGGIIDPAVRQGQGFSPFRISAFFVQDLGTCFEESCDCFTNMSRQGQISFVSITRRLDM